MEQKQQKAEIAGTKYKFYELTTRDAKCDRLHFGALSHADHCVITTSFLLLLCPFCDASLSADVVILQRNMKEISRF